MTVERWERRAEVPLLLLALAFLVAYAWPVLDPRLDPTVETFLGFVSWTVWVAFALDFAVRLALAGDRRRYALRHWYDVALIALPVLRPLRLLRLLAFLRILNSGAVGNLAGRVTTYVIGAAVMSVGLGAVAVLDAEQDAKGWKPVEQRKRKVTTALKAYAAFATSADRGAVRDLGEL